MKRKRNAYAGNDPVNLVDPSGLDFNMMDDAALRAGFGVPSPYMNNPSLLQYNNLDRMIQQIEIQGGITQFQHYYDRQQLNDAYLTVYELKGRNDISLSEISSIGGIRMDRGDSIYHTFGIGNENNLKFIFNVSPAREYGDAEIVLKPMINGLYQEVTDPRVMGTYNFGYDSATHMKYDVLPLLQMGKLSRRL